MLLSGSFAIYSRHLFWSHATLRFIREETLRPAFVVAALCLIFCVSAPAQQPAPQTNGNSPLFTFQEVMIPVRDGVHLQTVILTPVNATGPLPILFRRTPYGVPAKAPEKMPPSMKE